MKRLQSIVALVLGLAVSQAFAASPSLKTTVRHAQAAVKTTARPAAKSTTHGLKATTTAAHHKTKARHHKRRLKHHKAASRHRTVLHRAVQRQTTPVRHHPKPVSHHRALHRGTVTSTHAARTHTRSATPARPKVSAAPRPTSAPSHARTKAKGVGERSNR